MFVSFSLILERAAFWRTFNLGLCVSVNLLPASCTGGQTSCLFWPDFTVFTSGKTCRRMTGVGISTVCNLSAMDLLPRGLFVPIVEDASQYSTSTKSWSFKKSGAWMGFLRRMRDPVGEIASGIAPRSRAGVKMFLAVRP